MIVVSQAARLRVRAAVATAARRCLRAAARRRVRAAAAAAAARLKAAALPTPDCRVMTVLRHQLRQPSLRRTAAVSSTPSGTSGSRWQHATHRRKAIRLQHQKRGEQFWREGHLELLAVRHDPAVWRTLLRRAPCSTPRTPFLVYVAPVSAIEVDVNFLSCLPQALVLAALELREERRSGVDLGQAVAEKVEGVHLQHGE